MPTRNAFAPDSPAPGVPGPPTGTVTFLFSDIEGSTRLLRAYPAAYPAALDRHYVLLQTAVEAHGGVVFETGGDAVFAAFTRAQDGLAAALEAQRLVKGEEWGELGTDGLRVRMALHTGDVVRRDGRYFGAVLYRCARILSAGYGGQVLVSGAMADLVRDSLPVGASLRDLGEHRLKDWSDRPEHLFQLYHADLTADFPPLRTPGVIPNNLPVPVTSFIGREGKLARVLEILESKRLLTLTGPGGSGKTRLAVQAASAMMNHYPDGVWFVDLAALAQPELVPNSVATAVGVREEPGRPILATLVGSLSTRRVLLVLDNCEHLLEACARLTETLLQACPSLVIMTTSREVLNVSGETTWRVPPLDVADPAHLPPPEQLTQYEAVRLFIDRASAVVPGFSVTNANAPAVAQICWRLDGIPLAIELAAARVSLMSPEQIAQRLDNRFRLLTGGRRTALPRQQTLRALVDWSYGLLTPPEQVLFQRLSVFSGGWTIEAAEAVCADDTSKVWEVLDLLAALVDKSLVLVDREEDGTARYRLLETLRQYAAEKLTQAGGEIDVRARHRVYFVRLAEQLGPALYEAGQIEALARLDKEVGNIRAVLDARVEEEGAAPQRLALAFHLVYYWYLRDLWGEAHRWLHPYWIPPRAGWDVVRIKTVAADGYFSLLVGEQEVSSALLEECTRQAQTVGSPELVGWVAAWTSLVAWFRGDVPGWERAAAESLNAYAQTASDWGIAVASGLLGGAQLVQGRVAEGLAQLQNSLQAARRVGDRLVTAFTLDFLAQAAMYAGDHEQASRLLREALELQLRLGSLGPASITLKLLGQAALAQGKPEQAAVDFRQGLAIAGQLGKQPDVADELLEGLAAVAAATGRLELAARLFGAAETLGKGLGARLLPGSETARTHQVDRVRAALGAKAFDRAWNEGRAMSIEQVVRLVLDEQEGGTLATGGVVHEVG